MRSDTRLLSSGDHDRISAAIATTELHSDGEIGAIVAERSSDYGDWAIRWSIFAAVLWLAAIALWPDWLSNLITDLAGGWGIEPSTHDLIAATLIGQVLVYTIVRLILLWWPLRLGLTPATVKRQRVRKSAVRAFRIGTETRTRGATGVLIYLSLAEKRAEIVAEASIHSKVPEERWGATMATMLEQVRDGRTADGIIAAIEAVGAIVAEHFPRSADDTNELPDRLIEL